MSKVAVIAKKRERPRKITIAAAPSMPPLTVLNVACLNMRACLEQEGIGGDNAERLIRWLQSGMNGPNPVRPLTVDIVPDPPRPPTTFADVPVASVLLPNRPTDSAKLPPSLVPKLSVSVVFDGPTDKSLSESTEACKTAEPSESIDATKPAAASKTTELSKSVDATKPTEGIVQPSVPMEAYKTIEPSKPIAESSSRQSKEIGPTKTKKRKPDRRKQDGPNVDRRTGLLVGSASIRMMLTYKKRKSNDGSQMALPAQSAATVSLSSSSSIRPSTDPSMNILPTPDSRTNGSMNVAAIADNNHLPTVIGRSIPTGNNATDVQPASTTPTVVTDVSTSQPPPITDNSTNIPDRSTDSVAIGTDEPVSSMPVANNRIGVTNTLPASAVSTATTASIIDMSDDAPPPLESDDQMADKPPTRPAAADIMADTNDVDSLRREISRLKGRIDRLADAVRTREIGIRTKKALAATMQDDIRRAAAGL